MKAVLARLSCLAVVIATAIAFAQSRSKPAAPALKRAVQEADAERARSMFVAKQSEGLEIKVKQNQGGVFAQVDPGKEFVTGDEIRLSFFGNYEGRVYFINIPPKLDPKLIRREEVASAGSSFALPSGDNVIKFEKDTGIEILKVIMAKKPIPVLDEVYDKNGGAFGKNAEKVLRELNHSRPAAGAAPVGIPAGVIDGRCRGLELALGDGLRCRGLELAPGRKNPEAARKDEGTVIAIADNYGSKLSDGDIAVFELRLNHVPPKTGSGVRPRVRPKSSTRERIDPAPGRTRNTRK